MVRTRKKLFSPHPGALIAVLLFFVFILSCRGITLGHAAHNAPDMPMYGMEHSACCAISDSDASVLVHSQFQSALPALYLVLLFAIGLFFSFPIFRESVCAPPLYSSHIKRRFGSTRLFVYYVSLFSQGILHPKTF
ncbi:hypothetical protein BK004_00820 [bacterium CG10_46_32]|nr:MAG: hypothetical protein BK004_00820 [bacterium CG10_46_32]PIR56437.1 MAG: hypothetical protein COU73_00830 [Parcubacteria group bacterium CG10_big_fil_rev_8_21_14_0_10_46_32]